MRVIQASLFYLKDGRAMSCTNFLAQISLNRSVKYIYSLRKLNLPPLGHFLCHTPGF